MSEAPYPSLAAVQTVLDERPIRELEASGFIREHLRK